MFETIRNTVERARRAWRSRTDKTPYVLCADDDESVRVFCASALKRVGYTVEGAADGREFLEKLRERDYCAILLDLGLPYVHGTTLLAMIAKTRPEILSRLIVITGASEAALPDVHGARIILRKPVGAGRLIDTVDECTGRGSALDRSQTARG